MANQGLSYGAEADDQEAFRDDEEIRAFEAGLDDEAGDDAEADDTEAGGDDEALWATEADDTEADDTEADDTEADDTEAAGDDEAIFGEDIGEPGEAVGASISGAVAAATQSARRRADARTRLGQAAQRSAALFATNVQQKLNRQLARIPGPPSVPLRRIEPLRGSGVVTARLPNGRTTQIMFSPALAGQQDVNRLTQQISINDARQARAIRVQGRTIIQLKSAQASANRLHKAELLKISKDLNRRITDGDTNLDKRIAKEVSNQRKVANKDDVRILREIRRRQRRAMGEFFLLASSIPLYAAYGERAIGDNANPISKKNLILTGSLAAWWGSSLGIGYLARDSKTWRSVANVWPYLAAIGNAGTVYFFMKDQQHERFITGVTAVTTAAKTATEDLLKRIGKDYHGTFKGLKNIPVVATIQSGGAGATKLDANVDNTGKLTINVAGITADATVAWQVDTIDPANQRTSTVP